MEQKIVTNNFWNRIKGAISGFFSRILAEDYTDAELNGEDAYLSTDELSGEDRKTLDDAMNEVKSRDFNGFERAIRINDSTYSGYVLLLDDNYIFTGINEDENIPILPLWKTAVTGGRGQGSFTAIRDARTKKDLRRETTNSSAVSFRKGAVSIIARRMISA